MNKRQQLWLSLLGIALLTVTAVIVDYPKGPNIVWQGELVREVKVHLGLDLQGGTSLTYEADLSNIPEGEETEAMAGVRDVLERRVNAFGVSEPLVQTNRAGEAWRVLVELPGITDVNQAVNEIGETPLLEFKVEGVEEYTEEELADIKARNTEAKTKAEDILQQVLDGGDFAQLANDNGEDATAPDGGDLGYIGRGAMVKNFEEAAFGAEVGVVPEIVETRFGYHIIRVDEKTEGVLSELNGLPPEEPAEEDAVDTDAAEGTEVEPEEVIEPEEAVKVAHILISKEPETPPLDPLGFNFVNTDLSGKQLDRADVQFDHTTNQPLVSLNFNQEGAQLFEDLTREHQGERIAIYLDGFPISTPSVNQVITGGEAVIQGDFTVEEAQELSRRLNAGALPVEIELVNQRNVGPTLGAEAIERSVVAGILGFILLSFYMIIYYRLPGVIAVVALTIYGLMLLAIFKLWPITLTLSGVAGFILSLGIAVDANVLIFERLKEELRNGKSVRKAVDDGFKRAWLSIRDSNVSSLITCVILIWFGTSVIKGFAITLAIGIALSMFSAITITRNILKVMPIKNRWWYGVGRK